MGIPISFSRNKTACTHPDLEGHRSIIKQIIRKDILLHFPYQKFDYVVDLLREAAIDPKVESIKINVYRVANRSQVMNALINAVSNGKEVTVVLELQARFDEENNLYWADRLKDYGAKVLYGYEGLKIHSKLLQIRRVSEKKEQLITYVGTGNFNERSAEIYTDLGLLTIDRRIATEVHHVFQMMEQSLHHHTFSVFVGFSGQFTPQTAWTDSKRNQVCQKRITRQNSAQKQ